MRLKLPFLLMKDPKLPSREIKDYGVGLIAPPNPLKKLIKLIKSKKAYF
jgi:hypothetical protein